MQCSKCGKHIPAGEEYTLHAQTLCEDCYLDRITQPKACDPWAVYTAKNLSWDEQELTDTQRHMLDTLREKGPMTLDALSAELNISFEEIQRNLAVLRHMELMRGFKKEGVVYLTLFSDQENITSV